MKTEIVMFRHGQTDWNRDHRSMGATDIPLNEMGRNQAQELALRLAGEHFDVFYSSPLVRARETATIVARFHALPIFIHEDLREMSLGLFEGKLKEERMALFPTYDAANDEHRRLLGMETFVDWIDKLQTKTIPELLALHAGQRILISTHDQKMRALLVALGEPDEVKHMVLKNCEVKKVKIDHLSR